MQPIAALQKRFEGERVWRPFQALPQIGDNGLTFGRGTVLARCAKSSSGQDLSDADQTRTLALLAAVYGKPVAPQTIRHIARAAKRWRNGDAALAQFELAFARLPRLETDADAYRLFLADRLLDAGLTPRELMQGLGLDPGMLKYDPNQPRVPAGNGRTSGQWGAGNAARGLTEGRSSIFQAAVRYYPRLLVDTRPTTCRSAKPVAAKDAL